MDLDWNPRITRVWAKRGRPMRVMTPGQNEKKTVFGAVSVAGKVYYSIQARKRAVNFLAFLEHVLQRVAKAGQQVLLILDHYGIHTAKTVGQGRRSPPWPSFHPIRLTERKRVPVSRSLT